MQQKYDRHDQRTRRDLVRSPVIDDASGDAVEVSPEPAVTPHRPPTWQLVVTAILLLFLGAQFFAGWKFLNGQTYPVVGSAMFNGPPIEASEDFLVPRVIGTTASGAHVELDQHTFGLEPFEWRAWIIDNLETVGQEDADAAGAALVTAYASQTGERLVSFELWRVPALTDDFGRGHLILTVDP